MKFGCLLCGVGGQGTVLSSRVIAHAAMNKGYFARTAETIGMAQRGGSVVSHVRVGDSHSPLIIPGEADLLIGLEPGEAVRNLAFVREGGVVVVADEVLTPVSASLSGGEYRAQDMLEFIERRVERFIVVSAKEVRAASGTGRTLNVAMLGAAASAGALPFTIMDIEESLRETLNPKIIEMNLHALYCGAK